MKNDATTESASFLERLGDFLTAASEWISRNLTRMFGSSNERTIRSMGYVRAPKPGAEHTVTPGSLLAQVNALEEKMKALTDAEMAGMTVAFRARLAKGETLDSLLPEAFAATREAGRRSKNMRHFDTQILGGIVLHRGNIAEMMTGEGKTLVATLPAYLNALVGQGVHVITVNDYLARRDCEWMLPIYRALGMEAGYIQSDMDPAARRKSYDCDITFGTNSEFGFDYLRDNMKPARWGDSNYEPWSQQCQKALHYAIIDEVDNILIDEARTPLIISGPAFSDVRRYGKANEIAVKLAELETRARAEGRLADPTQTKGSGGLVGLLTGDKEEPKPVGVYYEVKEKEHTCHLTDEGVRMAEELAGVESFYTAGNMEWPHLIDNALKAHHLYRKDKQYAVMRHPETNEMSIVIIDEFTGRLMLGRQWSDGLHQAVEAKHVREGVKIKEETQTLATVTLQNFFKLYKKLSGMTGTAMTEADEFWKIYHLEVIAIPTNRPLSRINHADIIFRTGKEKWKAVVEEIVEVSKSGRPVLVGTTDVDKSLKLSDLLKRRGIRHELLNALPEHAAREAEIVAQAGRVGMVTISTNMAGRGTDIILGGNPETLAWAKLKDRYASRLDVPEAEWKALVDSIESKEKMKEEGRKVAEQGGLHIVGTERHDARRIDNQLRGRAGRQGDPGSSRFYLSLEDDLMRLFAGEWVSNLLARLGMQEGEAIESRMVSRRIESAQRKVEERHFDSRKNLLEYDEVMDKQRKDVYSFRQQILDGANCKVRVLKMFDHQIELAAKRFLEPDYGAATFAEFASKRLNLALEPADFVRSDYEEAERVAREKAVNAVDPQVQEMLDENLGSEDAKEWNWQALAGQVNSRFGTSYNDRQLKQIGKDNLFEHLRTQGHEAMLAVDLSEGKAFVADDWGVKSLCDWARLKCGIKLTPEELLGKDSGQVADIVHKGVLALYREKEVTFPVMAAMARFMSEKPQTNGAIGQRYNREGLHQWAVERFPTALERLPQEEFLTQSRLGLQEVLLGVSRSLFPTNGYEALEAKLSEVFEGSSRGADAEDAKDLAEWARTAFNGTVVEADLVGAGRDAVQDLLTNAFDRRYRPEMHTMERSLVLSYLDNGWKNHLYTMDHLRSTIGLYGYAQEDPKAKYKQEGMKEFYGMWDSIEDKVIETVFRMEETEAFQENLWTISSARHDAAPKLQAGPQAMPQMINSGEAEKKTEPIRNRGEKVGRNDPCPCGSGKKYKNCHMRQTA